jgi:hypothetical protein
MMNQGDLEIRPARAEDATAITECVAAAHRRYIVRGKPPGPTLPGYKEVIERRCVLVLTGPDRIKLMLGVSPATSALLRRDWLRRSAV